VDEFNARIKSLDAWHGQKAKRGERVLRLQTYPGTGLLTSPAPVHALESVTRFTGGRKVAAYVGLDPMEYSSGEKQRFGSISKGGSRLLRYLLVEASQVTVRRDEGLKRFYLRLLRRRGTQKAKVAVARKLLICGYIICGMGAIIQSSSAGVSKRGLSGLQHRLLMPGVCDWAASPPGSVDRTSWAVMPG
jgi:transposase